MDAADLVSCHLSQFPDGRRRRNLLGVGGAPGLSVIFWPGAGGTASGETIVWTAGPELQYAMSYLRLMRRMGVV